jgi:hypothetical protein
MDKKYMDIIKPSEAFTMYIQSVCDVLDCREKGMELGIIKEGRSDLESICLVNALSLLGGRYDHDFSPVLFNSLLYKYCVPDMSECFQDFYTQLLLQNRGEIIEEQQWSTAIEFDFDIYGYAEQAKKLNQKKHWGMFFREPFLELWNKAFEQKKSRYF